MWYWIHFTPDGEGPDEMNTTLIGPLPDGDLTDLIEPGELLLEPVSFEEWQAHIADLYRDADA